MEKSRSAKSFEELKDMNSFYNSTLIETKLIAMIRIFIFIIFAMTLVHCSTSKKSAKAKTTKTTKHAKAEESGIILTVEDRLRRLSGVNIQGSGRDAKVTIRGLTSLTNNTEVLFVVDGVTVLGGLAAVSQTVNVNDIKNIRVLKSAMETTLYGVQGAGGVIEIDLKKE